MHFMKKIIRTIFCLLARLCILRHKPFVIGITGSFGKTTARHVITEILRRAGRDVWTAEGNYNGEWGLAFSVLQIRSSEKHVTAWLQMFFAAIVTIIKPQYPAILVLEYWIDHIGEMDIQTNIVEPDIALFTKLSPSHIEGFGTEELYYVEKQKLIRRKHKKTYAIGNADDSHQADFSCQIWYGKNPDMSDLILWDIIEHPDGLEMDFSFQRQNYHLVSPILWEHHAGILAGAFLVAEKVGIPWLDIVSYLRHIHLPYARGNILKWINESLVIDGTYNGGFEPIVSGVEMLVRLAQKESRKTIALIGDMRELGALETLRHEELWSALKKLPVDYYIFVWAVCMEIIQPLIGDEWSERTFFTLDSRAAGEYIKNIMSADTHKYLLFAKWSQNTIYLEEALKYFIFPDEYLKLVRQDPIYTHKKKHFYTTQFDSLR
jgi:UDP-N-acetylmuramoyl-tripeptide--D-alanyl-D-alanine ligase